MASDEELMQAVASGDMDAFGELVRRNQRSAWNAAWRLLGAPQRRPLNQSRVAQ